MPVPPMVNGLVYARENTAMSLTAYDARSGTIRWSFDTGLNGDPSGDGGPAA